MDDNRQPDKLDQLLDSGLERYSSSEPLAGLEERLLARLEVAARDADPVRWFDMQKFGWAAAALLLALGIGLGLYLTTGPGEDVDYYVEGGDKIDVSGHNPVAIAKAPLPLQIPLVKLPKFKPPFVFTIPTTPAKVDVKQEVFPAAAPLTEQERLALAFVRMPPAPKPIAPERGIAEIEVKPVDVAPLKIEALGTEAKNTGSTDTESRK